jgi:hypothetical protein
MAVAKAIAQARKIRTGKAVSELARRGWQTPVGTRRVGGFVVFDVAKDGGCFDVAAVRGAEDADDVERHGGQCR